MSAPPPQGPGGFSLFPNTASRPPSRSQNQQRPPTRSGTPQERPSTEASPPRAPRIRRDSSVREGKQRVVSTNPWQHALDARETQRQRHPQESEAGPSNAVPSPDPVVETAFAQPVNDPPQRCETAFSEAQTLVRSNSARSRSSIAKPPLTYAPPGQSSSSGEPSSSAQQNPPQLRSIFPTYNPELPLDRQEYYPKEASPTHIPQAAISRPLYSPRRERAGTVNSNTHPQSPPQGPIQSPAPTAASASRWPNPGQRHHEPAVIPPVSSTEELRSLWKVTNGWKASSLEGRPFCLKLTASPDAPVYTLSSSSSQPFYCLRVDPTSASALVSLSRYDPNKPFKQSPPSPNGSPSSSPTPGGISHSPSSSPSTPPSSSTLRTSMSLRTSKSTRSLQHNAKNWLEVLTTTLTPPTLRNENDGLVAHLWPSAAARLVADRSNDATTVALAQQESARLVFDPDSGNHFLVHPALAMPFCVTVERNPVYSRTEYTLEHLESPVHLAKLTRDGTGQGWLEVDTSIAAKIEAVYLVDVVVAALVLVAHSDEQYTAATEVFEPPPVVFGGANGSVISGGDRRSSRSSRRATGGDSRASMRREEKQRKKEAKKAERARSKMGNKKRMEQFEIDLESQDSGEFGKRSSGKEKEEKLPAVLRALVWLIKIFFKCLIGSLALVFKCLGGVISGLARCCGLGKL